MKGSDYIFVKVGTTLVIPQDLNNNCIEGVFLGGRKVKISR